MSGQKKFGKPFSIRLPVSVEATIRETARLSEKGISQLVRESLEIVWTDARARRIRELAAALPQVGAA
jgi:hypothetical protein